MTKLLSIFLLFGGIINASNSEILLLRDHYVNAARSESDFKNFCTYLDEINNDDPTIKGYKAAKHFFDAKYGWNPISRVSDFNEGADLLDEIISQNPSNLELRYIRLAIQVKSPSILGYTSNIESDKNIILQNYVNLSDRDLKTRMKTFLLNEMDLKETEKQKITS